MVSIYRHTKQSIGQCLTIELAHTQTVPTPQWLPQLFRDTEGPMQSISVLHNSVSRPL